MRALGIRCSNSDFCFAVLEGSKKLPVLIEKNTHDYPNGYSLHFSLKWFRQEIFEILQQREIDIVVVKCSEGLAARGKHFVDRVSYESIVLLAAAENNIRNVPKKVKSTIAKDLGLKGRAKYLSSRLDITTIPEFENFTEKEKEAIWAAWSELP